MRRGMWVFVVCAACRPSPPGAAVVHAPPPVAIASAPARVDASASPPDAPDASLSPSAKRDAACARDREECIEAFVTDCRADPESDACAELVSRFVLGADPPLTPARRFALRCVADARLCPSHDACAQKNDAAACVEYGEREQAYFPGSRDFRVITAAYAKACQLNDAIGCRKLAFLYERGPEGMSDAIEEGVPFDKKVAQRLYERACTGGDKPACVRARELRDASVH